jgi:predicted metal-dependent enzyme (double-stranded beta helix superfamily)
MQLEPLRRAVTGFTRLVGATTDETRLLREGRELLGALVAEDGWLPDLYAEPDPERYRQYLLWCDPLERFSVVSFVWGPGQTTPVHDHTVWGLVGVLRGAEACTGWSRDEAGMLTRGETQLLPAGSVDAVSPSIGDLHEVANARADAPSVSIHVYGANIGRVNRHVYLPDGTQKSFVSGYTPRPLPNIWLD